MIFWLRKFICCGPSFPKRFTTDCLVNVAIRVVLIFEGARNPVSANSGSLVRITISSGQGRSIFWEVIAQSVTSFPAGFTQRITAVSPLITIG